MRFTFLLCFFSFFQTVYCQKDTTTVPIAAYWEKGDTFKYRVVKIKRTWNEHRITQNDSTQYIAKFNVIDADTGSYTIKWSFINTFFDTFGLPEKSRAKFAKYSVIDVIYKTDEFGSFRGIENWPSLSHMMKELIDETIRLKEIENNVDGAALREKLSPMLAVYSTKYGIEQLLFKEIFMFHFPFGHQYERLKTYNYTEQLPVMQNFRPFTGSGIIFIRRADFKENRCELVQRMKILPDTIQKTLSRYFYSLGMNPAAIGSAVEASNLQIADNNIYDMYYYPGIPVKFTISRETTIEVLDDRVKQIDQITIERIE